MELTATTPPPTKVNKSTASNFVYPKEELREFFPLPIECDSFTKQIEKDAKKLLRQPQNSHIKSLEIFDITPTSAGWAAFSKNCKSICGNVNRFNANGLIDLQGIFKEIFECVKKHSCCLK